MSKTKDYDKLIKQGVSLGLAGDHIGAQKVFDQALKINPNGVEALRYKGVSLSKLGDEEAAIKLFDQALEINPQDYDALRQKGVSLSILGDVEAAIKLFDQALEINPQDYDALRQKGVSLSILGDVEAAIKLYDQALEINPQDYHALRQKGVSLFNLKNHHDALISLEQSRDILKEKGHPPDIEKIDAEISYVKGFVDASQAASEKEVEKGEKTPPTAQTADTDIAHLRGMVARTREVFQDDIEGFKLDMNETDQLIRNYITASSPLPHERSFFFVLRKWNSFTPILSGIDGEDSVGGGYFLFHQGQGVVIDPGYNFIDNFHKAGLRIADINHIIITHAHNDHTVDFESLLSLFHQYNRKRDEGDKHSLNIYLNQTASMKLNSLVELKSPNHIIHPLAAGQTLSLCNGVTLQVLPAYHSDTIGDAYAVGLHFTISLKDEEKEEEIVRNIVLTSDTSLLPRKQGTDRVDVDGEEIWRKYNLGDTRPDLLIPHIGSVREEEFDADIDSEYEELFYPNHLGVMGTLRVITALKPELAVVSEFGEELKAFRPKLIELIERVAGYYKGPEGNALNVLPGDLPFVYDIKKPGVFCIFNKDFIPAQDIAYKEISLKQGNETFTYFDKNKREGKSVLRLRKKTEQFLNACNNQTAPYFKPKEAPNSE